MANENHIIYIKNLGILSDYINNTKNHIFKIYPSGRAIAVTFDRTEFKFSIRNGRNSINMEFIGQAISNSNKPYKMNNTKSEFEFDDVEWLEKIFAYMQKTILENRSYYN